MTITKTLEHKYFPLAIAIIAFSVSLPTIKNGLMLDDLIHRTVLVNPDRLPQEIYKTGLTPEVPGRLSSALFDTFGFIRDNHFADKAKEYGSLPWWTPKDFKASMWRPISSFTHWLDYRLFPDSPMLMHIHHLMWFSLAIFLIAVLYRRLIGPTWVAAFAAILFLIDENNIFPVMFNAHRNAFIALVFGLLCTLCHHHWRKNNSAAAGIAAPFFLLLSLLSAEAGIATFAFVLAYALFLEKSPTRKRIATILPAVCTIIFWRLIYNYLGYGVVGLGQYVDPVNEPVRFILNTVNRLPIMLFGLFSPMPPDFVSSLSPEIKTWFVIICTICLFVILAVMIPILRKKPLIGFLIFATAFAVIPFCACFPSARNLLFASVPGFALIAVFITDVFKKAPYLPKTLFYKTAIWLVCISLFLTHLPVAALGRTVNSKLAKTIMSSIGTPKSFSENITKNKSLVVINTPCALGLAFIPFYQAYEKQELPNSIRALAPAFTTLVVKRTNENTLVFSSKQGNIFSCDDIGPMHTAHILKCFNDLFVNRNTEFQAGQILTLPKLTVTILSVSEKSMPTELQFTFDVPLEDDSLVFYRYNWRKGSHFEFEIPAIGQSVEVAGPPYARLSDAIKFIKWQITRPAPED